jgi:hypothetical protein
MRAAGVSDHGRQGKPYVARESRGLHFVIRVLPVVPVHCGVQHWPGLGESKLDIRIFAQAAPHRIANILRINRCCRHLIKQWLEQMAVVPVQD